MEKKVTEKKVTTFFCFFEIFEVSAFTSTNFKGHSLRTKLYRYIRETKPGYFRSPHGMYLQSSAWATCNSYYRVASVAAQWTD